MISLGGTGTVLTPDINLQRRFRSRLRSGRARAPYPSAVGRRRQPVSRYHLYRAGRWAPATLNLIGAPLVFIGGTGAW